MCEENQFSVEQGRSMSEGFLRPSELAFSPDILRPGSRNAHLGRGVWAWIAARYPDPAGVRFFKYPASRGHESFICEENILQAMFGEELPRVREELLFSHDEYEQVGVEYQPTGRRKSSWDWIELRRRAEVQNLFGRYGTIRGLPVLMCWNHPEGWAELLKLAVEELAVPHDAILTCGKSEIGLVRDHLTERAE